MIQEREREREREKERGENKHQRKENDTLGDKETSEGGDKEREVEI